MLAPSAKVSFPPKATDSAYGPILPLVTFSNAALQSAIADIDAPQQHFRGANVGYADNVTFKLYWLPAIHQAA